jgi:hypothetical protein
MQTEKKKGNEQWVSKYADHAHDHSSLGTEHGPRFRSHVPRSMNANVPVPRLYPKFPFPCQKRGRGREHGC